VRITDVTVVLHERSASGAASFGPAGRRIPLGVLRVTTDEGIEGIEGNVHAPRGGGGAGLLRCEEDAERMAGRVGVHPQLLIRILGAVEAQSRPQSQRPLMLEV
jgi:hypothetical protein